MLFIHQRLVHCSSGADGAGWLSDSAIHHGGVVMKGGFFSLSYTFTSTLAWSRETLSSQGSLNSSVVKMTVKLIISWCDVLHVYVTRLMDGCHFKSLISNHVSTTVVRPIWFMGVCLCYNLTTHNI